MRYRLSRLLNGLAIPRLAGQYSQRERVTTLRVARFLISFGGGVGPFQLWLPENPLEPNREEEAVPSIGTTHVQAA